MDVSQAEIPTAVVVGELRVVEAEQVKDCRVQVVNMDRLFYSGVSELIGCAVGHAAPDSTSG